MSVCCSEFQCVSILQCVAVCCSHRGNQILSFSLSLSHTAGMKTFLRALKIRRARWPRTTRCSTRGVHKFTCLLTSHTATSYISRAILILQHTVTHCTTLQHTATTRHSHTATSRSWPPSPLRKVIKIIKVIKITFRRGLGKK